MKIILWLILYVLVIPAILAGIFFIITTYLTIILEVLLLVGVYGGLLIMVILI